MPRSRNAKVRLDQLLMRQGWAESPQAAKAAILAGEVLVDEQRVDKCGAKVGAQSLLRLLRKDAPFASRGGRKLEHALRHFGVNATGKICLDIGSSTGGFTDCLLQRGAAKVFAVDAGTNQLAWKLRRDPRVVSLENTNARYLSAEKIGELVALVTVDVSFISVTRILAVVPALLKSPAEVLALVKPQFEVRREQVEKGGLVTDAALRRQCVEKVEQHLGELGFSKIGSVQSALPGASGNLEYFVHAVWRKAV